MPTFEFDDHIEPVIVKIGGEVFEAIPAIPADEFAAFMAIFAKIPPLVANLKASEGDDSGAQLDAFQEFIQVSIEGLEFVLTPDAITRLKARAGDRDRPIQAPMLVNVFSALAGYYVSGGKEAEDKTNPGPFEGDNGSSPSSSNDGGSSAVNSSSEEPPSTPGPTTT